MQLKANKDVKVGSCWIQSLAAWSLVLQLGKCGNAELCELRFAQLAHEHTPPRDWKVILMLREGCRIGFCLPSFLTCNFSDTYFFPLGTSLLLLAQLLSRKTPYWEDRLSELTLA